MHSGEYENVPLRGEPCEQHPLGPVLYKYAYYVTVRLSVAWRVPKLQGMLPSCPEEKQNVDDELKRLQEEARYAVYLQLLFRPFRSVDDVLRRAPKAILCQLRVVLQHKLLAKDQGKEDAMQRGRSRLLTSQQRSSVLNSIHYQ